jgi:hypothetical protein
MIIYDHFSPLDPWLLFSSPMSHRSHSKWESHEEKKFREIRPRIH